MMPLAFLVIGVAAAIVFAVTFVLRRRGKARRLASRNAHRESTRRAWAKMLAEREINEDDG